MNVIIFNTLIRPFSLKRKLPFFLKQTNFLDMTALDCVKKHCIIHVVLLKVVKNLSIWVMSLLRDHFCVNRWSGLRWRKGRNRSTRRWRRSSSRRTIIENFLFSIKKPKQVNVCLFYGLVLSLFFIVSPCPSAVMRSGAI